MRSLAVYIFVHFYDSWTLTAMQPLSSERKKEEADKRKGGKTLLKFEIEMDCCRKRVKVEQDDCSHLWCSSDLARLWDGLD